MFAKSLAYIYAYSDSNDVSIIRQWQQQQQPSPHCLHYIVCGCTCGNHCSDDSDHILAVCDETEEIWLHTKTVSCYFIE